MSPTLRRPDAEYRQQPASKDLRPFVQRFIQCHTRARTDYHPSSNDIFQSCAWLLHAGVFQRLDRGLPHTSG